MPTVLDSPHGCLDIGSRVIRARFRERALFTCEADGCTGHLGKFGSCLSEALYELSLDGGDETTGDVDFHGHFTLLIVTEATEVTMLDGGKARKFTVPAGNYIVVVGESGMVEIEEYESAADASAAFRPRDDDYAAWLEQD